MLGLDLKLYKVLLYKWYMNILGNSSILCGIKY